MVSGISWALASSIWCLCGTWPIRYQYPDHVITFAQSEESILYSAGSDHQCRASRAPAKQQWENVLKHLSSFCPGLLGCIEEESLINRHLLLSLSPNWRVSGPGHSCHSANHWDNLFLWIYWSAPKIIDNNNKLLEGINVFPCHDTQQWSDQAVLHCVKCSPKKPRYYSPDIMTGTLWPVSAASGEKPRDMRGRVGRVGRVGRWRARHCPGPRPQMRIWAVARTGEMRGAGRCNP